MTLSQWKEAILEGMFTEIEQGLVEDKNLERLESLVHIFHREGSKVPESVVESYCQLAVECTARRILTNENDAKEAFRSIWLGRVLPLCDKVSCLVTRDLLNSCKRLWTAHGDDEARERLMVEDTREKALASLRKVVSEMHPNIGDRNEYMYESSQETGDTEPISEEGDVTPKAMDVDKDIEDKGDDTEPISEERDVTRKAMEVDKVISDTEEEGPCGELKAASPPRRMKTISSAVVAKTIASLRGSTIDLMNALAGRGGTSNLNVTSTTQQEKDVANPAATKKHSFMERRAPAQIQEWDDSFDDSNGENGEANNKSRGKRIVMSPLKRNQVGGRSLRASKIDLMNALGGVGPSNLNVSSTTQQENDVANPAATKKHSFMERRPPAQTQEWDDFFDDSNGENGEANNKARGKRIVMSPLKRNLVGGRRPKLRWSTAETLAVMRGYEKYGANWKRIKEECEILVRRTTVDMKDKFRVEMMRKERQSLSRN